MAINHLQPLLAEAEESGDIAAWWFIRKRESWRLRILSADSRDATAVLGRLTSTLTERAAIGHAEGVIYESETRRFGGPEAMRAAHEVPRRQPPHPGPPHPRGRRSPPRARRPAGHAHDARRRTGRLPFDLGQCSGVHAGGEGHLRTALTRG
ncbi:thiopeptide-type bacteriocin biosynthesis protein [Streptomyces sp. NPDC001939]